MASEGGVDAVDASAPVEKPQAVQDAEGFVAEDPFDTVAWSTIMNHAKSLPAGQARDVFQEFLRIFPTSVGSAAPSLTMHSLATSFPPLPTTGRPLASVRPQGDGRGQLARS